VEGRYGGGWGRKLRRQWGAEGGIKRGGNVGKRGERNEGGGNRGGGEGKEGGGGREETGGGRGQVVEAQG